MAMPLVVEPGKKTKVVVRGVNVDGLTELRVHEPKSKGAITGKPKKVGLPNNYPLDRVGDSEIEIELDVAKDSPGGTLAFSVVGPGGESNVIKVALADETPRSAENEPNDGLDKPQTITLPAAVDGKIDRERDADVYSFVGKKGERVSIDVLAARLGSPADLHLTLFDSEKNILDTCDDANSSADPSLTVTLPKDGTYFISLIESNDLGGAMFPYRLIVRKP
ncbi:MAG: PPC domain-containing protein [Gemmataceae bacterium]|nr:PPC domain-containing protein [Gemmataceae bacterium]